MRRVLIAVLTLVLVALGGALGWGLWWLDAPLSLREPVVDLSIEPGTAPRAVAQAAVQAGVQTAPQLLFAWFRVSGQARQIKAGSYEFTAPLTPRKLLAALVRGDEALRAWTLVEGWNFAQLRASLQKAESLTQTLKGLEAKKIMEKLGRPGQAFEGAFYPDTYLYAKGSTDVALLQRAARAMDAHLAQAWAQRQPDTPLQNPQQLLTLASVIEKETGRAADRPLIAAVFINRLRLGMLLQTDPTVIYGLGERFDGNLRKRDLLADTPFNTYTRAGLPPTPIAMPGKAALMAAAQPARSTALYFVARGDGSSVFSDTLQAHNAAVNRYQRRAAR
ncbi:MAG: endolytic transglycosylase MltG [Rhodoferax sp.]